MSVDSFHGVAKWQGTQRAARSFASLYLFLVFSILVLLRLFIPDGVLNLFMNYSIDDRLVATHSSILEKLHPCTWGIFLLALLSIRGVFDRSNSDRRIARSLVIFAATVVLALLSSVVRGDPISLGYLVDNFILATVAGLIMISFPRTWRYALGHIMLIALTINSLIAISEFALGEHFAPMTREFGDYTFRAAALSGHPLTLGGLNAMCVSYVWLTNWSRLRKFATVGVLVIGCLAAGARFATLTTLAAGLMPFLVMRQSVRDKGALKILILIIVLIALPLAFVLLQNAGLTGRFQQQGLIDESAESRIRIFQIFDYITTTEFFFGAGRDALAKYATFGLKILVENAVVMFIFQFGAIVAFLLLATMADAFRNLGMRAGLAVQAGFYIYFALLFTGPVGKGGDTMYLVLLALAFRQVGSRPKLKN